jgi:hypothetical protein
MPTLTRILSTAAAALAVTASAAAADVPKPDDAVFRVPAGQIEHTITTVQVSGERAAASHLRNELYLSRTRAHLTVRDVRSNRLVKEITWKPGETRIYDRESDTLRISRSNPDRDTPPYGAAAGEAALQQAYLEEGLTRVVGEKVVAGRRALVVEGVPGKFRGDEPNNRTTAVVDAETFRLYERTSEIGGGLFKQVARHQVVELLDATRSARAKLAMRKHAGAKVRRR